mmetsp:Transcript_52368/g.111544  ORF Transcript_52368/g.111544 Transcript_52368/m.111544 type:complete len:89 (-) Transcript_52368:32-298(-)
MRTTIAAATRTVQGPVRPPQPLPPQRPGRVGPPPQFGATIIIIVIIIDAPPRPFRVLHRCNAENALALARDKSSHGRDPRFSKRRPPM